MPGGDITARTTTEIIPEGEPAGESALAGVEARERAVPERRQSTSSIVRTSWTSILARSTT